MDKAIDIVKANQAAVNQWQKEATEARANWSWMKYSMQIALKVRTKMKADKITQSALAARLGCTQQYVSLILKGKENITLETLARLESALNINLWGSNTLTDGYESIRQPNHYLSDIDKPEYGGIGH